MRLRGKTKKRFLKKLHKFPLTVNRFFTPHTAEAWVHNNIAEHMFTRDDRKPNSYGKKVVSRSSSMRYFFSIRFTGKIDWRTHRSWRGEFVKLFSWNFVLFYFVSDCSRLLKSFEFHSTFSFHVSCRPSIWSKKVIWLTTLQSVLTFRFILDHLWASVII